MYSNREWRESAKRGFVAMARARVLTMSFCFLLLTCMPGVAWNQDGGGDKSKKEAPPKPAPLTQDEKQEALQRFTATRAELTEDGKIALVYDFESMNEELEKDWKPALSEGGGRVRWTTGSEGSAEGISGILLASK